MKEVTHWGRPLSWGVPSRKVCWLVQPSSFDVWLPEDHTIMYVLTDREGTFGRQPPRVLAQSIDRECIAEISAGYYRVGRPHGLSTQWYDPQGNFVKKFPLIKKIKEAMMIRDHEASGEFHLENKHGDL